MVQQGSRANGHLAGKLATRGRSFDARGMGEARPFWFGPRFLVRHDGNGGEQHGRVAVAGCLEKGCRRSNLDEAPTIEDTHALGELPNDSEVVRYENVSQPEPAAQLREKMQHTRLHGDVKRRGRFIQDQHVGFGRKRARERGTLALASRQDVGVAVDRIRRQPDQIEQFGDAIARSATRGQSMHGERQADALADGAARVERRQRVLLHDLEPPPLRAGQRRTQLASVEKDAAPIGRLHAEDDTAERRLSRARTRRRSPMSRPARRRARRRTAR